MIKTLTDDALGLAASFINQEDFVLIFAVSFIRIYFPSMEILPKRTIAAKFFVNHPKL